MLSTQVTHQLGREAATHRIKTYVEKVRGLYREHVSSYDENWDESLLAFAVARIIGGSGGGSL